MRRVGLAGLLRAGLAVAALATLAGCGDDAASGTKTARTTPAVVGAKDVAGMFAGVPQDGLVLGDPKAKVTFLEFLDAQCPYCKQFAEATFPTIVQDFVRTGKVRYEARTLAFLGPDSERGARFLYAAGLQGKQADVAELIYRNQGQENSGYMTDAFLRRIGRAVPGLDVERALRDMATPQAAEAIAASRTLASRYAVTGTPTLLVGPTGGDLERIPAKAFTEVDSYRRAVQRAVDAANRR